MASNPLDANYGLVPHPREPRLLILADGPAWTLPRLGAWDAPAIRAELAERFGLDATVLRNVYLPKRDDDAPQVTALENHSPHWTPPSGARWLARDELDSLPLALPEHRDLIAAALDEAETGRMPDARPPWARPGWLSDAAAWVASQLGTLGYDATGPLEQVHSREWSAVLRVPTTGGLHHFQAEAPFAAFEPALAHALHKLLPARVPRVLATDLARGWMLTEDTGTPLRDTMSPGCDLATWETVLPQYATLQQETSSHLDVLAACGCPDYRIARLHALYSSLVADTDTLLIGQPGGLSVSEYEEARAFAPDVEAMCAALAAFGISETLHHDDFHPGNILVRDGRYVFFDWAEGALTHPFCSPMIALRVARILRDCDDAALVRLRDAYLAPWTGFAPLPRLVAAFTLAQRLALLLRALTWRHAVSQMESNARLQYGDAPAYWLRLFLTARTWLPGSAGEYS